MSNTESSSEPMPPPPPAPKAQPVWVREPGGFALLLGVGFSVVAGIATIIWINSLPSSHPTDVLAILFVSVSAFVVITGIGYFWLRCLEAQRGGRRAGWLLALPLLCAGVTIIYVADAFDLPPALSTAISAIVVVAVGWYIQRPSVTPRR